MRDTLAFRWLLGLAVAGAAGTIAGCGPRTGEVSGSPDLPAHFGRLKDTRGCPDLAGLYAWPPRDGSARDPALLPRALEVRLSAADLGDVVRLLELPDGEPPPAETGP